MGYGFSCNCGETLDTGFAAQNYECAERFADGLGWCLTFGPTDPWGGNVYVTCPGCATGSSHKAHLTHHMTTVSGLLNDAAPDHWTWYH